MADYSKGALIPRDDLTLPYIWVSLHLNAKMERDTLSNPRLSRETARMSGQIMYLLEALQDVPAQRWWDLCEASGWTVYGAVGLSWCNGATPDLLWRAWHQLDAPLIVGEDAERPCYFLNPALLPQSSVLSQIVAACGNVALPICVSIAALKDPLLVDVKTADINASDPLLKHFIKDRLARLVATTPEVANG